MHRPFGLRSCWACTPWDLTLAGAFTSSDCSVVLLEQTRRLPPDDPAWPPGNNSLKREMCALCAGDTAFADTETAAHRAKRLWHTLVLLDWTNGARGGTYNIAPDQYTTPLPANLNDDDLGLHVDVHPRSSDELTDVSFEHVKWQMAKHQRRVQDRIRKGAYTYEVCLEIDNDFRQSVSSLCGPASFGAIDSPVVDRPTRQQCELVGPLLL